jgi:multidrug efflux pump subunit AcrB
MKASPAGGAADGDHAHSPKPHGLAAKLAPLFQSIFRPLLDDRRGRRNRSLLGLGVALLIAISVALPVFGLVQLKMLPFDNKSEFQVIVDMPAGTPVEKTAAVLHELGRHLASVPEVTDYQAYAGTAAPINFNGLVRQYYLRTGGPGGTSTTFRLAPKRRAIFCSAGRSRAAIAWLCSLRRCLSTRLTWMSPTSPPARR